MKIQRIDHVGIEVRDLERAEPFYTSVMGLSVLVRLHNQVLLRGDGFNVALVHNPQMLSMGGGDVGNPLGKGHWAFRVDVATLAEALDLFQREGVPHHGPVEWGDHDCIYFHDPDGNLLEILAYP